MATILIVDDRPVNREFLVTLLGYGGHRLLEAADGAEGLALVQAERPDLVITDILMPTMDGYEFVRRLRADPAVADTRVIFFTAHYHETEARKLAAACGVAAVLTKPCEPEVVLRTVESALGHAPLPITAPAAEEFDREHLHLLTDKLSQKAEELRCTNERLTAMVELGLQLGSERDPVRLLQIFGDAAREIVGARYAVVGIPNGKQSYRYFFTSGMDVALAARVGRPGPLAGVLGSVLAAGRCFRAANHGRLDAAGVPPSFPEARAVLAAPILSPARVHGWVCLLDKLGADAFTDEDERLAMMLGSQVGRIYENGSLYADLLRHSTKLAEEVAERKRAEYERDRLFDESLNLLGLLGFNGQFAQLNPAWERIFGFTREELMAEPFISFVHPDDVAASLAEVQRMMGGAVSTSFEHRLRCKDGTYRSILWNATPFLDRQCFSVTGHDITERKRAEEALAERVRLASLVADVGAALNRGGSLRETLALCTDALVRHLDAAFARIWTLNVAGDVLELQASAGMYTHLDGPHGRVPVGQFKIGLIAQERQPHLTNAVVGDQRVGDQEWAKREGMVAFAGYPLVVEDRLAGVMALFAKRELSGATLQAMAAVADHIALGIEHKRTEESLRASEKNYRALFESNPHPMWVYDLETLAFLAVNDAAVSHYGYSRDDFLGMTIADIRPAEDLPALRADLARPKGPFGPAGAWRHRKKDGTVIEVEITSHALRFGDREARVTLAHDITERRRVAAERDALLARLQIQIERMPLAYILFDADFRVIDWNAAAERTFGYPKEEVLGMGPPFAKIVPPASWQASQPLLERLRTGDMAAHGVNENVTKDGRTISCEWFNTPLMAEDGRFSGLITLAQDVSDRKQLEEQYRQAQKMEGVGQLAGGVAHDFNNLLTIINGYSELVQMQLPAGDPLRGLVQEIGQAGERATSLTRQLLAFSRKQVLLPKVLDLNAVVTDTAKMLKRLIGEDVDLNSVLGPDLGQVKADPGQIEQVLINLAVNARDAMPQGGKLTIETANVELDETYTQARTDVPPGRYVLLAVTDTGTGMDAATKAHIFEPFFTTKELGKGTGLGLATVFGIVKQSEGHIAVYSELGQGTTIKIYLPAVEDKVAQARPSVSDTVPLRGIETVLLTEDEPALRALTRHVLQMHGYTVLEASQGEKALRVAENYQGPIHLLVTDVVMPVMSGRQLAERLTAVRPDLKVLYLSGYTDDAIVRHGVLRAEMAFLQKPFTPRALAAKVREVLDQ